MANTIYSYSPQLPPHSSNEETNAIAEWFYKELLAVARQMTELHLLKLEVLYVEPPKPRQGMIVFADGTSWNPGSGEGTYEYRGGAWQKF